MTPAPTSEDLQRRLLAVATGVSGVRRIPELLTRLRSVLAPEDGHPVGIGVLDEERRVMAYHLLAPPGSSPGASPSLLEVPLTTSPPPTLDPHERRCHLLTPAHDSGDPLLRELAALGTPRIACVPLCFGERLLGALLVIEPSSAALDERRASHLLDLARVVEPHVWNCAVEERFARGDRRRDALRELSRVINTSLDVRTVLHLARVAIGSIEGHRASWIGLLEEDGRTWLRHDRPSDYRGEPGEPVRCPLESSVLARLSQSARTLESDDLEQHRTFPGDDALLAQGVRRYVVTPLLAGGKLLGGFLFGTDDPHPALRIDLWLLENIAVQIALALDNAQHHEVLQRLSQRREQQNAYLREELRSEQEALGMLGRSRAMEHIRDQIARVAGTDSTVLIAGPTGVGKELVARALHAASPRRDQPLVKLNCAAIPEGMVESELFGHERGAFTSAVERRIGRFELAHQGTLFLDEIGELSLGLQAKLLRVLQSGEFERVGGTRTLASNARILAATNRDLEAAVASGAFRADLYYRLNVFPIDVPPLDERREDVPILARAFAEHFARRMGKRFEGFEPRSLEGLCAREWPGNVRELKHVIERAMILNDGPELAIADGADTVPRGRSEPRPTAPELATLEEIEAAHIRSALARTGWVIEGPRGAAALLGLKSSTLRFRMKRKGIRRPEAP